MRQNKHERGQVVILALVSMGLFLFGALGLAIDGANLYFQRQMAQAAADAAAQAAMMSVFNHTNTSGTAQFDTTAFTCTTTSGATPCVYARNNGFGATAKDTVLVEFPTSVAGVPGLSDDPVNLIQVTVSRAVDTTLMGMLGPTAATIRARAVAAILQVTAPTPILVLHPDKDGALEINGGGTIEICGGPGRSVQVNSKRKNAYRPPASGFVDLRKAGPNGPMDCNSDADAGADFAVFGGPGAPVPQSDPVNQVYPGSEGDYLQPSSPIEDPYRSVLPPAPPGVGGTTRVFPQGIDPRCPVGSVKACVLYTPGVWATGIEVKNATAFFSPGIYYMGSGGGFETGANGNAYMCPPSFCVPDAITGTGWTENMLVYNSGNGLFDVGSNGNVDLNGSPVASEYKGILFFQDRTSPPNNSTAGAGSKPHRLGGGGWLDLQGTIYLTNTRETMANDPQHYQELYYAGNPASNTWSEGDIVVDSLYITGTADLRMKLDPNSLKFIRQVALVK